MADKYWNGTEFVEKKKTNAPIDQHEGKKYLRTIWSAFGSDRPIGVPVDVYAVLKAFGVVCPARAHAIKKLLCCGNRGKGTEMDDLVGAMAALNRAIDIQRGEDSERTERTATPGFNNRIDFGIPCPVPTGGRNSADVPRREGDPGVEGERAGDKSADTRTSVDNQSQSFAERHRVKTMDQGVPEPPPPNPEVIAANPEGKAGKGISNFGKTPNSSDGGG